MIYTTDRLAETVGQLSTRRRIIAEARSTDIDSEIWVFLSHSHHDWLNTDIVENVKLWLGAQNVSLYVDAEDAEMPRETSPETARLLKKRIRQYEKFILLLTPRSARSVWCGWEIGVADSMLKGGSVLIWPLEYPGGASLEGNEYLGIYPSVEESEGGVPMIFAPGFPDRGLDFRTWLTL